MTHTEKNFLGLVSILTRIGIIETTKREDIQIQVGERNRARNVGKQTAIVFNTI